MRKRTLKSLTFLFFLGLALPLSAQSPVQYVYDALGRLTQVIDPSGNVATYNYDAVGNLLSITRSTASPSGLSIFSFSPGQGSVGQTVTIQGQNFSTTPSADAVQFNGTAATVTAATANSLTTTVPAGATTGPISVTVGTSTAASGSNFTVLTTPLITSLSQTLVLNTPTITGFQVNGSNLTGATFSFLPAFSPAAISASNVNINGNGTSATMTLTLASSANGSFTVVATTSSGSSSQVPSTSNTLTVLSTNPSADFDGDGLTNIYEAAIGTNFADFSTTNDGLPDGWALFYTSTPPLSSGLAGQTAPNGLTYLHDFQQGLNPLISTVAPSVANVFPANLATNYPTNGVIVVRFTEPLQAGVTLTAAQTAISTASSGSNFSPANSAAAAQVLQAYLNRTCCGSTAMPSVIQVSQGGRNVNGSVFLSDDHMSLIFVPNQFLSASTLYTVTVEAVKDAGGNLMAQAFQSTFTTGLTPFAATNTAVITTPVNNATGVQTNAPFRIGFPRPVNPLTLNSQTFVITDHFTGQAIQGTLQVDPSLLTASFVPSQPYGVGRFILVDLTPGIEDFAGTSFIPAGLAVSFTTAFTSSNQGPTLLGTSPADQATNVPLNALVVIQFSEPIDQISALSGLQVQQSGVPIAGAIALSNGNTLLTFTPSAALAANSTYLVVTTDDLKDFAGNPLLNPDSSTFTTGSASDTTSPTVASVSPDNTTTGVPTNTTIQLTFSKQIDPLTVTTSSFTVSPKASGIPLAGTIVVSSSGLIATFTPSVALDPSTNYTVLATNAINDLEGHTLTQFPSTFTTASGTVVTAPTVVMVSPPNGATGVQVNAHVDVALSAPIAPSSVGSNAITLAAGGTNVTGTVALSSSRTTLTFTPTSLLAVSTTYTVTVSGITDVTGNSLTTFTSSFTTGTSGTADTAALSVASVSPTNGATGVSVNSSVVLTFNKNVDPTTVNNATVSISNSSSFSPVLAGNYSVSGAVVTFTPLTPMPGNANTNVVAFANGVKDFAGNTISSTFSSSFTTGSEGSTSGPSVTVVPNNGATAIGLNSTVVLTFSESLSQTTINTTNFGLLANGGKLPISIGRSADNRVVTLSTNSGILPASSTITVVATSGVLDLYGNALANFTSQFATAAAFDTTHPSVIAQRPGTSATGVSVNTNIVLYVSEAMNAATVPGALHVSQNGVLVAGTAQVTDSGQTIQFTPSSPFANDALVQVFLDTTAQDVDGNSLSAYQGSFTTAINTAAVAPSIVGSSPTNSASSIPTNVIIDVASNEALNPTTINTSTVTLTQNSSTIATTPTLLSGGTIIQILPSSALAANTTYSINVKSGVQGTNGLAFANNSILFTTGAGTDTTQPALNSVSPPNGSTGVGNNSAVRLVFNKAINPLTVNGNTVQLTGGGTTQDFDAMTFASNNQSVLLIPHGPLPDSTVMTLTISGITDLVGNAVPTETTHFTTGIGPDVLVPAVLSTSPSNNESGVPLNAVVQARMNEPIDPGTVNSSALTLTDNTANQTVNGTPSLSTDGLTVRFLPGTQLAAGHNFTVAFGNQILRDLVGNGLVSPGGPPNFIFAAGTSSSTTAPQVAGVSPPSALTSVPVNAQVLIQFNEPIDPLSIGQVTLSSTGGNVIVATTVTNGNEFLILDPVVPLSQNTAYTVTVTGVQDLSGNVMTAQATSSFTTGTAVDLTLPAEQSVSPTNGATGVLRSSAIQFQFSKRVDALTVSSTTFTVTPSGGQPISGTFLVSSDGLSLTFTPSSSLAASTVYSINATSGITDLEGQALTAFSATFTTGTQ